MILPGRDPRVVRRLLLLAVGRLIDVVVGSTACSIVTQVENLTGKDLPEIGGYRMLRRLADLLSDADIRWWPPDEKNQAKCRRVATTYAVRQ